ncbi:hypothetical protein [Curtobacterium sp. Leaf261]|uniref:hypothetical protein n=1 Tax=Curtobacterium sp. Leaf261 TaxID=1736311 RepID=UPI0006FB830C|nr:hypothetical protein [Curtobacterium sp. Leaf261]KQO61222.1 hypothetical protein ASF23_12055 [Curtobacterium sp. Leaf261]
MFHLSSTTRSTSVKIVTVGATVLAAAALLSGCATGSSSSSASGSASASTASSSPASQQVPANFPKAVPLVDGDVIVARGDADNGWSATISPATKGGFARAAKALEKAGFDKSDGGSKTQATYTDDDYSVSISTPGTSVSYLISTTH